jgi:hypothetical protein
MKQALRSFAKAIMIVFVLAGSSGSVMAQDKGTDTKAASAAKAGSATTKVLFENDKVRAQEITYKPGDENTSVPRDARVVRALTAGTLLRTYPDGKTEKAEWKAGEVRFNDAVSGPSPQYTTKNVGKSELVLYLVILKGTSQPAAPAKK